MPNGGFAPFGLRSPGTPKIALTIAGSDSGGGAGIQADLKVFHQLKVFGVSAVTAVTAQNTRGVHAVAALDPDLVRAQIDAVRSDLPPAAIKTGMLANAGIARAVVEELAEFSVPIVVDPVMVATSGDRLLEPDAVEVITRDLLPLATLVTPNLPEAEILAGRPVRTTGEMSEAARILVEKGAGAALIKGGHMEAPAPVERLGDYPYHGPVVDILWDGEHEYVRSLERIPTKDTHGTGCALSAAVTASLADGRRIDPKRAHHYWFRSSADAGEEAVGLELVPAVARGLGFIYQAIGSQLHLGAGRGPVDLWEIPRDEWDRWLRRSS